MAGTDNQSGSLRPVRPVQENIPPTRAGRDALLAVIQDYVKKAALVPPLSMGELRHHSMRVVELAGLDEKCRNFAAVILNNEVWRETVAGIPFDRRLLLLPQCLRAADRCPATLDELGLLCRHCGACAIHDLQTQAQALGYVVMVAEGTAVVTALIETGKIEAVVGVSCLSSLERVFPYMEAGAVPGMAMPLLQDGCANTTVDLDWVWDALYLTSEDRTRRLSLETLRHQVEEWFKPAALDEILGPVRSQTEGIARAWLAKSGKRWRPFLTVCAFAAFQDDPRSEPPADFRKIALAVECFHKASLIHDDIEDSDALRYGEKTLHEEYGVPVALNAGDFLLGEGYRLIAECACPPAAKAQMLQVAAGGHLTLCTGQGEELCWMREPAPLSPAEVVEIFRRKTAPAFEVALRLGAIYAGAGENVCAVLSSFSEALGVAYQIRDDLDDFAGSGEATDLAALRPSWLLATAYAAARDGDRELLEKAWRRQLPAASGPEVHKVLAALNIPQAARSAMEQHKERAILSLQGLENANLKGLLRRVLNRIFNEVERMGKCCDAEAGNAASGPAVGGSAA